MLKLNFLRGYLLLEQLTANKEFREVHKFFSEIQYWNVVPILVRESDFYLLSQGKEDFYGRNLIDRISVMNEKRKKSYLKRINEVLQLAVPQLNELDVKKDEKGVPHLTVCYTHWLKNGVEQSEEQLSDGTLRLIGFLWALLDGTETVLLEEPEINLYAEIIRHSNMQRRKNYTRQVMITIHSYDLLDNNTISMEEVIVLQPTPQGTVISKAKDIQSVKQLIQSGFTMTEAIAPVTKPKDIIKLNQLTLFD